MIALAPEPTEQVEEPTRPSPTTPRRLTGQREVVTRRSARRIGQCAPGPRRDPIHPRCGSGQPRQVPDDLEAPPRERDRPRPFRRRLRLSASTGRPARASGASPRPSRSPRSPRRPPAPPRRVAWQRPHPLARRSRRPGPPVSRRGRARPGATGHPNGSADTTPTAVAAAISARPAHHDRPAPRAVATDRVPAARSVSRSTRAFATARPAPASIAIGTRMTKKPGSDPVTPSQPYTGSRGMPTANGNHDHGVPLAKRS